MDDGTLDGLFVGVEEGLLDGIDIGMFDGRELDIIDGSNDGVFVFLSLHAKIGGKLLSLLYI